MKLMKFSKALLAVAIIAVGLGATVVSANDAPAKKPTGPRMQRLSGTIQKVQNIAKKKNYVVVMTVAPEAAVDKKLRRPLNLQSFRFITDAKNVAEYKNKAVIFSVNTKSKDYKDILAKFELTQEDLPCTLILKSDGTKAFYLKGITEDGKAVDPAEWATTIKAEIAKALPQE